MLYSHLFFRHVFPVAAGHVIELLARVHPLANADGLKVGAPEILQQLVVAAQHLVVKFAVTQVEGDSPLVFEGDADNSTKRPNRPNSRPTPNPSL